MLNHPAWTQEERFATLLGRKAHEDELDALMAQWTQGWEAYELMHTLQHVGIPAGVVQTSRDLFEDSQLQHRGHFIFMDHPEVGRHPVQRSEFRLSQAPGEFRSPAPVLGQHTVQVCKEILNMSEDEIDLQIPLELTFAHQTEFIRQPSQRVAYAASVDVCQHNSQTNAADREPTNDACSTSRLIDRGVQ